MGGEKHGPRIQRNHFVRDELAGRLIEERKELGISVATYFLPA
jgi:hypothetical protein